LPYNFFKHLDRLGIYSALGCRGNLQSSGCFMSAVRPLFSSGCSVLHCCLSLIIPTGHGFVLVHWKFQLWYCITISPTLDVGNNLGLIHFELIGIVPVFLISSEELF